MIESGVEPIKIESEVRDRLALERTILSNERTYLSYIRTALAFAGLGIAMLHLESSAYGQITGWTCLTIGLFVLMVGSLRYRIRSRKFDATRKGN